MPVRHRWQIILAAQGLYVSCKSRQTLRMKKSSVKSEPSSGKVQCGRWMKEQVDSGLEELR